MKRASPLRALRVIAETCESSANELLRVAERLRHQPLRAALAEASNILSVLGTAFQECAEGGTADPMQSLAEVAVDWVSARIAFALTPTAEEIEAAELARLVTDGCPHTTDWE